MKGEKQSFAWENKELGLVSWGEGIEGLWRRNIIGKIWEVGTCVGKLREVKNQMGSEGMSGRK